MDYISVTEFANKHAVSERTVRNWCASGKIEGAFLTGKTWNVPIEVLPPKLKKNSLKTISPLLSVLREEKNAHMNGGIYHKTQIELTYNSNHIEGSRLTHDQTRYIFETNTIGNTDEAVNVDDVVETVNHFKCVDMIIDCATDKLTESFIKQLHSILKSSTSDSRKSWLRVGNYKILPNEVGGTTTTAPEEVAVAIKKLLKEYNAKQTKTLDEIIDFHKQFESIHPFQDGNGRVGRLIMFKECLANNIVPFIITEEIKMFYYRGLQHWPQTPEFLRDTCLTAQDNFKDYLNYFRIEYVEPF